MVFPRTSTFGSMFRTSAARTAGLRGTSRTWRAASRRTYASGHGPAKRSSDLPWMIGSIVVTVPSAAWLWQQGPKTSDHGHGHGEHEEHAEHAKGEEESKDKGGEEGKGEGERKSKDDSEAKPDDGDKDESPKNDESPDSGSEGDQDTPPTSDDGEAPEDHVSKSKGEKTKGSTRPRTETQEEKGRKKDVSGASNPYSADPEKSKKGEGVADSARIHGTVDPGRKIKGPEGGGKPKEAETDDKKAKDRLSSVQT